MGVNDLHELIFFIQNFLRLLVLLDHLDVLFVELFLDWLLDDLVGLLDLSSCRLSKVGNSFLLVSLVVNWT